MIKASQTYIFKNIFGQKFQVNKKQVKTILQLKNKLYELTDIEVDRQKLVIDSKILKMSNKTFLKHIEIPDSSLCLILVRTRNGIKFDDELKAERAEQKAMKHGKADDLKAPQVYTFEDYYRSLRIRADIKAKYLLMEMVQQEYDQYLAELAIEESNADKKETIRLLDEGLAQKIAMKQTVRELVYLQKHFLEKALMERDQLYSKKQEEINDLLKKLGRQNKYLPPLIQKHQDWIKAILAARDQSWEYRFIDPKPEQQQQLYKQELLNNLQYNQSIITYYQEMGFNSQDIQKALRATKNSDQAGQVLNSLEKLQENGSLKQFTPIFQDKFQDFEDEQRFLGKYIKQHLQQYVKDCRRNEVQFKYAMAGLHEICPQIFELVVKHQSFVEVLLVGRLIFDNLQEMKLDYKKEEQQFKKSQKEKQKEEESSDEDTKGRQANTELLLDSREYIGQKYKNIKLKPSNINQQQLEHLIAFFVGKGYARNKVKLCLKSANYNVDLTEVYLKQKSVVNQNIYLDKVMTQPQERRVILLFFSNYKFKPIFEQLRGNQKLTDMFLERIKQKYPKIAQLVDNNHVIIKKYISGCRDCQILSKYGYTKLAKPSFSFNYQRTLNKEELKAYKLQLENMYDRKLAEKYINQKFDPNLVVSILRVTQQPQQIERFLKIGGVNYIPNLSFVEEKLFDQQNFLGHWFLKQEEKTKLDLKGNASKLKEMTGKAKQQDMRLYEMLTKNKVFIQNVISKYNGEGTLSLEDEHRIGQLMELGFTRQQSQAAYLQSNKDFDEARSKLAHN